MREPRVVGPLKLCFATTRNSIFHGVIAAGDGLNNQ